MNYLDDLNSQQRAAVEYLDGPQLVIAGAGSGKTRVLTYKIVHLLESGGYEPWRIMALTFTNKAANEMRERIRTLTGARTASQLWMGTFHSIFARILRRHAERVGFRSNFTIYDAADSRSLVKTIVRDLELDEKVYKATTVANTISWAKNALISPEDYAASADIMRADTQASRPRMAEIYRIYRDRCVVAGAMDFDDLLYYTNVLLRDNPDVLALLREQFLYVLVDEYQDTNFAQHLIVRRLTEVSGRVMVVGDDAQSIYSFRGANISNILELRKSYPGLQVFKLEQNYRSTRTIIEAANSLIEKNTRQIPKHVFTTGDDGDAIEVVRSYSDFEESFLVANRISQVKMATRDSYNEFAILYRTNAQSRILEEQLRKRNIPYRIWGGLSFYQRKEVKDAIAYFRLTLNPGDDEALKRVINFPARGIGDTTVNKIITAAIADGVNMWEVITHPEAHNLNVNRGTLRKLEGFAALISSFIEFNTRDDSDAYTTAAEIIGRTGLLTMLMTERTPESISKQENLQELLAGAKEFVEGRREEGAEGVSLQDFMAEVSLATDQDSDDSGEEERVTLMTVHAAKGLEFGNVFIVGLEEELFPSSMGMGSPAEIEEERRLLYVAITRAKRFCMMSYAGSRFRNGQTMICRPSRFIADIDRRWLNFVNGSESRATRVNPIANYRSSFNTAARTAPSAPWAASPSVAQAAKTAPVAASSGSLHSVDTLSEGMRISHAKFGLGTIASIDASRTDTRITVEFDNTGSRVLLLKFARFSLVDSE